jgi:glycosyltransferase EpsJ
MKPNREPLISVVLPTYNVAQYLQQCLESVAAQTYRNIEVIIIIDGATDGSYEIAQDFCKTDSRFSVYWHENAGSGPARNAGLARCKGEFVMFVDTDDWIEPELLEKLYEAQQEGDYDFVASRRNIVSTNANGKIIRVKHQHFDNEKLIGVNTVRKNYVRMLTIAAVGSPTQKLYKLSVIRANNIDFPALRRSQDICFNYRYYSFIHSLCLTSYSGYNWRVPLESIAAKYNQDYYKTIITLYTDIIKLHDDWNIVVNKQLLCNYFFKVRIVSYLQQCAKMGWSIKQFMNEQVIRDIVKSSSPNVLHLKTLRFLLINGMYGLSRIVLILMLRYRKIRI